MHTQSPPRPSTAPGWIAGETTPTRKLPATWCQPGAAGPVRADRVPRSGTRQTWLGRGLVAAGLGMIPWLAVLGITLPSTARAAHWPAGWMGLDGMEGLGLLFTGLLLLRHDARCSLTAAVTAALVLTDAWFDVTTAAPGSALVTAIAMAVCAEIPASVLCASVAVRTFPKTASSRG